MKPLILLLKVIQSWILPQSPEDKSDSGRTILSLSLTTPWRSVFEIFTAKRRTLLNCFFPGFSPENQPAHNLVHISNKSITIIPMVFHHDFCIFFEKAYMHELVQTLFQLKLVPWRMNLEFSILWFPFLPQGKISKHGLWYWEK